MQGDYPVARVYLLDVPYHIDKLYDYYIPEELRGTLAVGGFAAVIVSHAAIITEIEDFLKQVRHDR